ncbi:MAG: GNAT family N-acetyltransferase [Anaerolineae bacterium]|nr:GNAT family N-acetyltransferase [Anaerolineae bacterium]
MSQPNPNYHISTDPEKLDLDVIFGYLSRSYWANQRPRDIVAKSLRHSLCFGVYENRADGQPGSQVGMARVVTDYATYAYLCDVFILEAHQGRGLGKWLMHAVTTHPDLQGLRRWMLATRDAHGLYRQVGFADLVAPDRWMERFDLAK